MESLLQGEALLRAVDLVVILAIMGITEAIKRSAPDLWRFTPLVPLALGFLAGLIMTPENAAWRVIAKSTLLYGGAAAISYEVLRTTLLKLGAKSKPEGKIAVPK